MDNQLSTLLAAAEAGVASIFEKMVHPAFYFHNLDHTRQVAAAVKEIAAYYKIGETEEFVLLIAAWFHDTGFSAGKSDGHEMVSAKLATDFLQAHQVTQEIIQQVRAAILVTQMPQVPRNLAAEIMCDADLYHLGTHKFFEMSARLRKEIKTQFGLEFSEEEWTLRNLQFLSAHKYFTGYCRSKLEPVKEKWIRLLATQQ